MPNLQKKIIIVIPCYQEAETLQKLYLQIEDTLDKVPRLSWRYIFVNDGSTDNTADVLWKLRMNDSKVGFIELSRNFGKEVALSAGLNLIREIGDVDAAITMDSDLQHPPELIPDLVEKWLSGSELVIGVRKRQDDEPFFRKLGSKFFYWLMRKTTNLNLINGETDFRLLDIKVVEAFNQFKERQRMVRGVLDWIGFRRALVGFVAPAREKGSSTFTYRSLYRLAISSFTVFSLLPLKVAGFLGFIITGSSAGLIIYMIFEYFFGDVRFFTPLAIIVVSNTFLSGLLLVCLGFIGQYVGNTYSESQKRPLYVVRDKKI